jgi:hypothetical protein
MPFCKAGRQDGLQPVAIFTRAGEETRRRLADIERPVLKVRQRLPNCGRYRANRMIRICCSFGRTGEPLRRLTKEFPRILAADHVLRVIHRRHVPANEQADQLARRRAKRKGLPERLVDLAIVNQALEPLDVAVSFLVHSLAPVQNSFDGAAGLPTAFVQPAPQRAGWNVEEPCGGFRVVALEVDQRHGFTQSIRQSTHGVLNQGRQLEPFQDVVRPLVLIGQVLEQSVRRGTTALKFEPGFAHDDRPQPGSESIRISQ